MGGAVDRVFARLDSQKRGLLAIGGIFALGLASGLFITGDVKAAIYQVPANTSAIMENSRSIRALNRADSSQAALLARIDSTHLAKLERIECLLIAERRGADPLTECGL